jgi:hypothetical protein
MSTEENKTDIETLTLEQLILKVKEMRFQQRRYRRSERKEEIIKTLDPLEKDIDDIVARFVDRQTKLF